MNQNLNVIEVLLVEDDPGDVVLIREAFEHNKVHNALHVVSDGVEALEFLRREGEHADARGPTSCCSTSTSRARTAGEVLAEVKADADLRTIPVVVLTTSEAEEDIAALLRPARQRLRDQAGRLRPLHRGRAPDRRLLRLGGQAAEPRLSAFGSSHSAFSLADTPFV